MVDDPLATGNLTKGVDESSDMASDRMPVPHTVPLRGVKRQARKRVRSNPPDPETNGLSEYEIARLKRIKENEAMLREFGIDGSLTHSGSGKKTLKASSDLAMRPKARTSGLQSVKQVFRRNTTAT